MNRMLLFVNQIDILLHELYDLQVIVLHTETKTTWSCITIPNPWKQTEHPGALCAVQQLKGELQSFEVPTSSMSHCFTSFPSFKYSTFQHTKYVNLLGYSSFWIVYVYNSGKIFYLENIQIISYKPYLSWNNPNNWF